MANDLVSDYDKKNALQLASWQLLKQQAFYGNLLQEFVIRYSQNVPTAAFHYNKKLQQFEILLNTGFFCTHLNNKSRVGVLHHEVLHFSHQHMLRLFDGEKNGEIFKIKNIAADMAINQFIKHLPEGCVDVASWKLEDGSLFPTFQSAEHYFELIKSEVQKNPKGKAAEQLQKYVPMDDHQVEELSEEEKQKMLEEAKRMVLRTIEKSSFSHSAVPDSLKDFLTAVDTMLASINYKQILKQTIKKTVSGADREHTFNRPNKRYGVFAPGSKVGQLPKLHFYGDTSGSISHVEFNQFLQLMDGFCKVGARDSMVKLWHTALYTKFKYKKGLKFDQKDFESGGTDVSAALADIEKARPNLAIIYTDGYFDASAITPTTEIVWIITEGGNCNHPMKHLGKTIPLGKLVA